MGEKNSLREGFPLFALNPVLLFPKAFVVVGSDGAFFPHCPNGATGALLRRNPVPFQFAVQVAALKADGLREPCDVAAAFVELRLKVAGLEHGPGLLEIVIRGQ